MIHRHHRPHVLSPAAAAVLAVFFGPPGGSVVAQQQVNTDGRALDASQQVGSGGTNRVENQVDYQARNNLITGNVAGGFQFRDSVGYTSPGGFRGQLGSDDLFRFRAESLPSAAAEVNLPDSARYRGANVTVYNNFTTVPQGNAYDATNPSFIAPQGGDIRVNQDTFSPRQTLNLSSDPRFQPGSQQRESADTLGVVIQQDGTALSISADPLTGVRRDTVNQRRSTRLTPDGSLADPSGSDGPDPARRSGPGELDNDPRFERAGSRVDAYLTPQRTGNERPLQQGSTDSTALTRGSNPGNSSSPGSGSGRVAPGLVLGQLAGRRADAAPQSVEERVVQLQDSIFGSLAPRPGAPGTPSREGNPNQPEDAYQTLLETIRQQARDKQQGTRKVPGQEGDFDPRPDWMKAMDEPTEQQLTSAEQRRQDILTRMRSGESETGGTASGRQPGQPGNKPSTEEADAALDRLMNDLTYDVRLDTLAADREGRVNELFKQAEDQMAAGQFLEAERSYRLVLVQAPDNPLGQIGLVHAQLGSGLIRSAAFNLRSLFEEHPELIATRYSQDLLPPADRLEWLRGELQRMVDADSSSLDPGIMLGYLGHQVESRQLVRYGLAIAEEASPLDPLVAVLRRIWLADASGKADPSPPSDTPGPGSLRPASPAPDADLTK